MRAWWRGACRTFHARLSERRDLRLPRRRRALTFAPSTEPFVSVAVLAGRDWRYANRCLHALLRAESECALEILVFHDAAIEREMQMHAGVQTVLLPNGTAFTVILKEAAARARGRYLFVLDAHAVVSSGALGALASTLDRDPKTAMACSMLRSPGGRLREAGRTILRDGSIQPYGFNGAPKDSRFDFLRDVESVSPQAFMIRTNLLRTAPDASFTSADYVTAALCAEMRALGLRCVNQPLSAVVVEGGTSEIVSPREAELLAGKLRSEELHIAFEAGSLLVVDEHVPFEDRDAGSRRLSALLRLARTNGWSVVFGSLDKRGYQPYWEQLKQSGIEVKFGFTQKTLEDLSAGGVRFGCVWLSRPQVATAYLDVVRSTQPQAKIVYDTVDLHHLRLARQARVELRESGAGEMELRELEAARRSDVVVVTGEVERRLLQQNGISNVAVVGLSEVASGSIPSSKDRAGILFIGNYAHAPNVDAARWLAIEIMPHVWRRLPGAKLTLAGTDPTSAVKKLANARIQVTGFIKDLNPLLRSHRVFAAPLRFGAGIKGKILQAMAAGIPIVTTAIGAEGILEDPDEMMIAEDAAAFAAALVELYLDDGRWNTYSNGALLGVRRFSPAVQAEQLNAVLNEMKTRAASG